ncbi:hypothetical protein K2173_023842 [Erythroxylum novogranatense]|uniref:Uncharacterized protein n=1 Tax=Erythroxylum novogranatense TaxID=1862640 RepID=A0AAV8S5J8_9ROSI|nr:hypothetical protein K2173_023842 [Erythroxylum novogranatense]
MAAVTVETTSPDQETNRLRAESIPVVDLRLLSQSELLSLSLCSSSSSSVASSLLNDSDVSTPKIDRSVFNESAGSRKQTFSRLRLAPRSSSSQFAPSSSNHNFTSPIPRQSIEQSLYEEDMQIVSLLKSLFGDNSKENENVDDSDLVPVPIQEYLGFSSVKDQELLDVQVSFDGTEVSDAIAIPTGIIDAVPKKRKRGRRRKNENNVDNNNDNKTNQVAIETENWDSDSQDIDVNENEVEVMENKDREEMMMVNKNGLVVDLTALREWRNWFARRVGSRRNKRKVVDADLFGDALPVGWKLMLCLKRKAGQVRLGCRRYISPNGRQFVSCKEVSSYLLSFHGLHDANELDNGHFDSNMQFTDKITSGRVRDVLKNDNNGGDVTSCLVLPIASTSTEHENQPTQLKVGSGDCMQTGKRYNCHKCTMSFDEQDDLLEHLLSFHQRAPKRRICGTSINEEAILKNGKYQCQFCSKIFEEKHRYNGHLGNHIKDYVKRVEKSGGVKGSRHAFTGVPSIATNIKESSTIEQDAVARTSDNTTQDGRTIVPFCEVNTSVAIDVGSHDFVSFSNSKKVEKMIETAERTNFCSFGELTSSTIQNSCIHKSYDEDDALRSPMNGINNFDAEYTIAHIHSCVSANRDQASIVKDDLNRVEDIEDRVQSAKLNYMEVDDQNLIGKDKPISDFGNSWIMQENVATKIQENNSSTASSTVPFGKHIDYRSLGSENQILISTTVEPILEMSSNDASFTYLDEKEHALNPKLNDLSAIPIDESEFDKVVKCGDNEQRAVAGSSNPLQIENISHRSCFVVPNAEEQMHDIGNNTIATAKHTLIKHQKKEYEGIQLTLSGVEQTFFLKNNEVKFSNDTMEVHNHNVVSSSKDSDSIDIGLVAGNATKIDVEKGFDSSLLGIFNNPQEKPVENTNSDGNVIRLFCDRQARENENNVSEEFSITVKEHKHKEKRSFSNDEKHFASYGKKERDLMVSYVEETCSQSQRNHEQCTFADEDNIDLCSGTAHELKHKRESVESILCLSGNTTSQGIENNMNRLFSGTLDVVPSIDSFKSSRKSDLVIDFDSHKQPKENVTADFMWGINDMQSADYFPAYSLVSDKGGSEIGQKFDGCQGGLSSMTNLEFYPTTSKMSTHSDESSFFSCAAGISDGFNSSFWHEKGALHLLPKATGRNSVPTICANCKNEFYHEAFGAEIQTASLNFICRVCKPKFFELYSGLMAAQHCGQRDQRQEVDFKVLVGLCLLLPDDKTVHKLDC